MLPSCLPGASLSKTILCCAIENVLKVDSVEDIGHMTEGVMRVFRQEVGRPEPDAEVSERVQLSRLPLEEHFRESSTGQRCGTCCGDHERRFVHQLVGFGSSFRHEVGFGITSDGVSGWVHL